MLEKKRLKAELLRVQAAKAEMDVQIDMKMEEVQRLKDAMAKQELAEVSIGIKLKDMGE